MWTVETPTMAVHPATALCSTVNVSQGNKDNTRPTACIVFPNQSTLLDEPSVEAYDTFSSVADVDIKACSSRLGELVCTTNFIATDMNVCADLELWDEEGYQKCNEVGYYSFEASYNLPNKTWWEDFAFEGLSFQIYVTLDKDLKCHGQFRTHIYYGNERWMLLVSVSSMALVFGSYYFVQKKRETNNGKRNLAVEETKAAAVKGGDGTPPAEKAAITKNGDRGKTKANQLHDCPDDESVTSTAYLQMLDFSPEGLSHRDKMEKVREAHFERLRQIRTWRQASGSVL
jgi:hypothetical protein